MNVTIEQWPLDRADRLSGIWADATTDAPCCYAVTPKEFSRGLLVDEMDDETCASSRSQQLLVAATADEPAGFAHLCVGSTEIDGEAVDCGIIRSIAFAPSRTGVGITLLEAAESRLHQIGGPIIDVFPIYHGYAFHNHKVGILSDRLTHVVNLLTQAGYTPHDGHLTLTRELGSIDRTELPTGIDIVVEKTPGEGKLPDIRVRALHRSNRIGQCRSVSGFRYADHEHTQTLCYTRFLGVDEAYRSQGIGRHLLTRALREMNAEGYNRTSLNCRLANDKALALYVNVGYITQDTSSAYVKDLGE